MRRVNWNPEQGGTLGALHALASEFSQREFDLGTNDCVGFCCEWLEIVSEGSVYRPPYDFFEAIRIMKQHGGVTGHLAPGMISALDFYWRHLNVFSIDTDMVDEGDIALIGERRWPTAIIMSSPTTAFELSFHERGIFQVDVDPNEIIHAWSISWYRDVNHHHLKTNANSENKI